MRTISYEEYCNSNYVFRFYGRKTFNVQNFTAIQLIIISQWQKYRFLRISAGTHAMLDWRLGRVSLDLLHGVFF